MIILKYLKYVVRHKWFVMLECFKMGLIWQGLVHDLSKLLPSEFMPYANYFYGKDADETAFDFAWLLHQKRNPHHWQFWILREDDGNTKVFPMNDKYFKEMVCDWLGAGKAQGFHSPKDNKYFETRNWYEKNKSKMILNPVTRAKVEELIGIVK